MPFPIAIAAAIAGEFLPSLIRRFAGDGAGDVAERVVGAAQVVTGAKDGEAALAALRNDPQAVIDLQRQMIAYENSLLAEDTKRLQAINETMRAEMTSGDKYVRRWRPTWGYVTAVAWVLQSLAVAGAVAGAVVATQNGEAAAARALLTGAADLLAALTAQWGIALTVLGVNVTSRSRDKQVAAGQSPPPSLFGRVVDMVLPPRMPAGRR